MELKYKVGNYNSYTGYIELTEEELRAIVIGFSMYILSKPITCCSEGMIGRDDSKTEYWPSEFKLILGELIKNGSEIMDNYIDNGYGRD